MCCFKLLCLWLFVTKAIENEYTLSLHPQSFSGYQVDSEKAEYEGQPQLCGNKNQTRLTIKYTTVNEKPMEHVLTGNIMSTNRS